ncbi:unnamed protein product [Toxocara canis]|uniref:Mitogen-activated protein kinase kinase kinase n=1 Tax=Toxocara canis TaxID=6265 RepID=A0A183TWP7_TOXCA|nr:unnamed protein product [Toxocara canis]
MSFIEQFLERPNLICRYPVLLKFCTDREEFSMLLDRTFRILKVSDFGTARFLETRMTVCQGTTSYMAPEVMVGKEYDTRCDIYSIGVVLGELMTRRRPETSLGTIAAQILYRVPKGARPDISSACCADISRLVNKCWLKEPKNRPHIEDVLNSLTKLIEIRRKRPSSAHLIVGKEDDAHKICILQKEYVHVGVICRGCKAIVRGRRFRCTECDNYDICEKCSIAGRHKQHITFRFDRPYRDEPRFIDEEMFSMEKLMVKLKNGRRLTLAYATGKRPHHFFLNFVSQKHLIEHVEDDPSVEQISEDDHFGAYYSDKRQRLDVVLRDMKTAIDAISFILQALDFNQTVVISAEENVEKIIEGILKTIVLLSITEDFRKVEVVLDPEDLAANRTVTLQSLMIELFGRIVGGIGLLICDKVVIEVLSGRVEGIVIEILLSAEQ